MERQYMNTDTAQWKELELTTIISEVGGGTIYKASKLTFYNIKRNQRLGLSLSAGVATA